MSRALEEQRILVTSVSFPFPAFLKYKTSEAGFVWKWISLSVVNLTRMNQSSLYFNLNNLSEYFRWFKCFYRIYFCTIHKPVSVQKRATGRNCVKMSEWMRLCHSKPSVHITYFIPCLFLNEKSIWKFAYHLTKIFLVFFVLDVFVITNID